MEISGKPPPPPMFQTPGNYSYQLLHTMNEEAGHHKAGRVSFSVKASNDPHVALGSGVGHSDPHWEIVLGGWGNSNSAIRGGNQGRNLTEHRARLLNRDAAVNLWIEWDENHLRIGSGGSERCLMEVPRSQQWEIKHMVVSTGWGSQGEWVFQDETGGSQLQPPQLNA